MIFSGAEPFVRGYNGATQFHTATLCGLGDDDNDDVLDGNDDDDDDIV